jgi:secondary thiamine-phosphate synthase enzyme
MNYSVQTAYLELDTQGHTDILNITDEVAEQVTESEIRSGSVTLFTPSATSTITTLEWEPGCLMDLRRALDAIADPDFTYQHNLSGGDDNGYAHVRAALMGPSLSIPIVDGALALGLWQQIVFLDFDNRPRRRRLILQLAGTE